MAIELDDWKADLFIKQDLINFDLKFLFEEEWELG